MGLSGEGIWLAGDSRLWWDSSSAIPDQRFPDTGHPGTGTQYLTPTRNTYPDAQHLDTQHRYTTYGYPYPGTASVRVEHNFTCIGTG